MKSTLTITEPTGKSWDVDLVPETVYTIGRAKENDIVLNDRRVSRHHAHVYSDGDGVKLFDGVIVDGEIKRSVNRVFVNGLPIYEKNLSEGDVVTIGETRLAFHRSIETVAPATDRTAPITFEAPVAAPPVATALRYDDQPLGHTQLLISAEKLIGKSVTSIEAELTTPAELKMLRRKAQTLEMLYELSKTLGNVFDLKEIFMRATDLIFRGTPADRVVALLADETIDGKILDYSLVPIAMKVRDAQLEKLTEKLTVSRTITQRVMRDKVALLSQDAKTDEKFVGAESIVSQGVRSTICAPLITESNVHGVVYADRLDPFATFTSDDLELISAVAAQTAVSVETVKAHKRLAREEVARANYSRFMPEYVVKQLLDNPNSFKLGGVNQKITVLFADIRGFTSISERENPEKIVGILNRYFTAMSEIIFAYGGTLDKYIGDGLMALFGAPNASPEDAKNALTTAVAMQKRLIVLNQELIADGLNPIEIGIGMHTGLATVGYIGSEKRSEYTAIGDTVNLAARLEQNSKGGQILISEATAAECRELIPLIPHEPLTVKNRLQPVTLYEVKWN
ncbi:MAG: FHA domain-containing protein [Acidobacteria bacterium]|nr:FHA domain-containing protein [Acidobacteriota bacterium]MBK8149699.1 FHA domain-containing protein [Acidobacteriota bacterium]MBK8809824.1 FHA domain-containing protein [Acidobacteriota bacterium]